MKVVPMKQIYLDEIDMAAIIRQHFHNQYPEATDIKAEVKADTEYVNDGCLETNKYYAVVTVKME